MAETVKKSPKKTPKKMTEFDRAKRRYNSLMTELCYEHRTIGTDLSEETENFTIKDMANECKYVHDTFYEEGHANNNLKRTDRALWQSQKDRLWRFWNKYKDIKA